jgi:hypothetical protein
MSGLFLVDVFFFAKSLAKGVDDCILPRRFAVRSKESGLVPLCTLTIRRGQILWSEFLIF